MSFEAFSLPNSQSGLRTVVLSKPASVVQLEMHSDGEAKLGLIFQLPRGTTLELCGDGYSERMVKVRYKDKFYFIFRHDLCC